MKCSVLPHITAEPRVPPYLPPHPVFLAPSPFFLYPSNGSAPCCPTPLPTLMPLLPKSHPSGWSSACIPLLQACCPQVSFSISSSPFPSHHPPGSFSSSVKVKSESEVAQLCPTLCNPMDYSPPSLLCPWNFSGKSTGVGCHFLLQGFFLSQGLNSGLLHCRQTLYLLSHQRSPLLNTSCSPAPSLALKARPGLHPCPESLVAFVGWGDHPMSWWS